jgi:hypothetical protein
MAIKVAKPGAGNDGVADPIGENCCDHDPQKQRPAPSLPFERASVCILGQGIGRDSVRHDGPQREQFGPDQKLIANDDSWHVFSLVLDLPIFR